jgi:hypothetical protein
MSYPFTPSESAALDRWITGNYGEDQFRDCADCEWQKVDGQWETSCDETYSDNDHPTFCPFCSLPVYVEGEESGDDGGNDEPEIPPAYGDGLDTRSFRTGPDSRTQVSRYDGDPWD